MTKGDAPPKAPLMFQWGIFPIVMGLAVLASWWLIRDGMEPSLAIIAPQFAAIIIVAVFEHVYPYHISWNENRADVSVDARHAIGIGILLAVITPPAVAIGVAVGGWLSDRFGIGLWPTEWPLLAQIALVLIAKADVVPQRSRCWRLLSLYPALDGKGLSVIIQGRDIVSIAKI